jgi:hypothetical protein
MFTPYLVRPQTKRLRVSVLTIPRSATASARRKGGLSRLPLRDMTRPAHITQDARVAQSWWASR